MITIEASIANLVLHLVDEYLRSGGRGGAVETAEGRYIRIKDLRSEEIFAFLKLWEEESPIRGLSRVRVVISRSEAQQGIPDAYLSEPGKAITYYRNHNKDGLLYFQTRVGSEEAGLESMFTIRDRLLRDGILDREDLVLTIAKHAWPSKEVALQEPPRELVRDCYEVLSGLPERRSASLREFVKFVLGACELAAGANRALDSTSIWNLVGSALSDLKLFPDPDFSRTVTSRGTRERRLLVNANHADLANASGTPQDADELIGKATNFPFRDKTGQTLPPEQQKVWRELTVKYCESRSPTIRKQIPFWIFEQLFSVDTAGKKLGERVRSEINQSDPQRLPEFDALDVEKGLNDASEKEALAFLDASSEGDSCQLKDLIGKKTLQSVEKAAYPRPKTFQNPLAILLETIQERSEDGAFAAGDTWRICLRLDSKTEEEDPSLGLFSFIFGATLKSVADSSKMSAAGLILEVDPRLLAIFPPPRVIDPDADPDTVPAILWRPLRIEIHVEQLETENHWSIDSQFLRLAWEPRDLKRLFLLWLATGEGEFPHEAAILALERSADIDQWLESVVNRRQKMNAGLNDLTPKDPGETAREIISARRKFMESASRDGLSGSHLVEYCSDWEEQLRNAARNIVPRGSSLPSLEALIGFDVIRVNEGDAAFMLPSHPIRLRWISEFLTYLEKALLKALSLEGGLNAVNARYHANWLKRLSPHQHPPLLSTTPDRLLIPVEEQGWAEKFVLLKQDGGVSKEWAATTDQDSLGVIAEQVAEYVHAHPHKLDGVSILAILPTGGTFPADLIRRIRSIRDLSFLPIEIIALTPRGAWEEMTTAFERVQDAESRSFGGGRFTASVNLKLIDFDLKTAHEQLAKLSTDLAVLPHFFGNRVQVNEHTEDPTLGEGVFHPLHDRTTYVDRDSDSGTVSVVLRPRWHSEVLNHWSTLNVRNFRSEAISPSSPEYVDFVKLRIRFEEATDLFMALHGAAHWVITLDQYVGRDQLENLPARPDVLLVKLGVGANGLYSLVVSSNLGRRFVVDRITKKIRALGIGVPTVYGASPGNDADSGSDPATDSARCLAERYYQEARSVYPGLILKSTGLAKTTQEVLGLMVAKRIAERSLQEAPQNGLEVWIPLDEHVSWFDQATGKTRADLCRITLDVSGEKLKIRLLVVEGKFRQVYDPSGIQQADTALKLLNSILDTGTGEEGLSPDERRLRRLWWNELIDAMENVSPEASALYQNGSLCSQRTSARVPQEMADRLRKGDFVLDSSKGLYSSALYEAGSQSKQFTESGVLVIISGPDDIRKILNMDLVPPSTQPSITPPVSAVQQEDQAPDASRTTPREPCTSMDTKLPKEPVSSSPVLSESTVQPENKKGKSQLSHKDLETRYQAVLDAFAEVGIEVVIPQQGAKFLEGPAFIQFRVGTQRGVDPRRLREKSDLLKLRLGLAEKAELRFTIGDGAVNIEVPKALSERYFVDAEGMWETWGGPKDGHLQVPLGEDQVGNVVALDFTSSNSPHLLIGGTTGSGKSEALNTLIYGLVHFHEPESLKLCLVDPKGTEFTAFSELPHLMRDIGTDDDDAIAILEAAFQEMQARYAKMKEAKARSLPEFNLGRPPEERLPWWVVVLDEYADLTSDTDKKKIIEATLKRLTQKARAAGIHIIVATQKPSADVINTTLRSNLPIQLALKTRSAIESRVIMDEAGAESLNGMGDALLNLPEGTLRIQCAKISPFTIE